MMRPLARPRCDGGYTLVEILVVLAMIAILAGMAVPSTASMMNGYRLKGNAQAINNLVGLAKMRASARFSRARVAVDLAANTFQLQTWNKTTNTWVTEGSVMRTATGVTFGVGNITAPPPNTQAAIGQSPPCTNDAGAVMANTACITFNSRGMPVANSLPPTGAVTGNSAIYVTDGVAVYGTTVTTTPLIKSWWSPNRNNAWARQ